MANEIRLEGFDKFKGKLDVLINKTNQRCSVFVEQAAKEWVLLAKRDAPKDFGTISKGISYTSSGLTAEVSSNAYHSRFVEFGTRRRKKVPAELASYEASLTYNKVGDYYDFLESILDWVKRKGLARITNSYTGRSSTKKDDLIMVAEAVALSILRNGIRPQPFFFKQKAIVGKKLFDNVRAYLGKQQ